MAEPMARGISWRTVAWGAATAVLLMPLAAMQFTDEVAWGPADFVLAGVLMGGVGLTFELAARRHLGNAYRAAVAVALETAFVLIWANLAVGFIGSEDNPANLMFAGVLAVGLVGTALARARPRGMARAMVGTAVAQALAAPVALLGGSAEPISPPDILIATTVFTALWLLSAWLFRKAAQQA